NSIKPSRVRAKEHTDSLFNQLNQKSVEETYLNAQLQEKLFIITALKNDLRKLKGKEIADNAAQMSNAATISPGMYKLDPVILAPMVKNNREAHEYYLKHTMEQAAILRELIQELLGYVRDTCPDIHKPSEKLVAVMPINKKKTVRFADTTASSSNMPKVTNIPLLSFTGVKPSTSCPNCFVVFGLWLLQAHDRSNDQVTKIMGYGDYQIGIVTISRVYYVEGLGHNLFFVGQFCDSYLEVAFRKHTCFVCNLEGVDLLSRSRGTNVYSLSIGDMMASSPICILSKATKTKSWLWHRRLSHLNFGALNHLAINGLVHGLPRLKFEKDHLCSACAMGKRKKQSHKPKSRDTNQEKLHLMHMDLCGPMRVSSVNRKNNDSENLGKLQAKADIGIFIGYAPKNKACRIYIRHTQKIIKTIHVDFDELTAMASEQSRLEPALHEMNPATPSLGLVPNSPPSAPFVPPSRDEWDLVFRLMFNELFSHPARVAFPVPVEESLALVNRFTFLNNC
ncbi:integrase, catalytic region, zinc finger, CCHC-type containing protein, partial [Tanacetum coccineum]